MTQTHQLLAVHAEAGVTEFEAPGADADEATNSETAMRLEDRLQREYGPEPDCIIIPADAPPNHPLVRTVDAAMPDLDLSGVLRERGNEPVGETA